MGDTNGADPETIGESSLLMGATCFPDENLSGGIGHDGVDVLCNKPPFPLNDS
jgi:chitosanase